MVPMMNDLKRVGHHLTGIFTSEFGCEELFKLSAILDDHIIVGSKTKLAAFGISNVNRFDGIILDQFAATKKHFVLARLIAKKVWIQQGPVAIPSSLAKKSIITQLDSSHGVLQLKGLVKDIVDFEDIDYNFIANKKTCNHIIFQPGSGNNKTPWKNWPLTNWLDVLKDIKTPIKVIGDHSETAFISQLEAANISHLEINIGKQNLGDLLHDINTAKAYIGHDSGPMHMAVACGVPTFTIWGGSPKSIYAYDQLLPDKNTVIEGKAVEGQSALISDLNPSDVANELNTFLNEHA
jgi:ADP-heptose:LPS heptosyltransferase